MAKAQEEGVHPASIYIHGRHFLELPHECIEAVLRHVLDIETLLSLLLVCKDLLPLVEKALYQDPFRVMVRIKDRNITHGRLLDRLLPLSPHKEEGFERMMTSLGHRPQRVPSVPAGQQQQQDGGQAATSVNGLEVGAITSNTGDASPPASISESSEKSTAATGGQPSRKTDDTSLPQRPNVLSHLRVFDYDTHLYNSTYFHSLAYRLNRDIVDYYQLRWEQGLRLIQSTFGWALYGHQLRQIQRLRIPIWDLEIFVKNLSSLVNIRVLKLSAAKISPNPNQPNISQELVVDQLKVVVRFLKAFQMIHGSEKPQECEILNLDVALGGEEGKKLEREFYRLLPPLPAPNTLNHNNWARMAARYEQVDLSQVTEILYKDARVEWPARQHKVLERCASLRFLSCQGLERDMFIFSKNMPTGWCHIQELHLECEGFIMKDLIDSAMVALHHSLTTAFFTVRVQSVTLLDPEISIGRYWPSFPNLKTLHIQSKETIFLHPHALHDAPLLEALHLQDETTMYNPYALDMYEPWRLPKLRFMHLQGMSSTALHPQSFAGLPLLSGAIIKGIKMDSRRYFMPRHPDNTPRGLHSAHLWTWDWRMPELMSFRIEGEPAYRFDFQWLEYCPRLQELAVDIGGHHRPLLLSPTITKMNRRAGLQEKQGSKDKTNGSGGREDSSGGEDDVGKEEDEEDGMSLEQLQEMERRGLFTKLLRQTNFQNDDGDDDTLCGPWLRSNLQHLELQGRWQVSDTLLQMLLFRNLRRLQYLVLVGLKGYTRWGLLESTRRHWCLERVESSQLVNRADARRFGLEAPEERRWAREGWRGGIQEWNMRPCRDANVQQGDSTEATAARWDWAALNPEKARKTKIPLWEQLEKDDEDAKKTNKAPVPKAAPLVRADDIAPLPAEQKDVEDDGAPGPSSYLAGLLVDDKERREPRQQQLQQQQSQQQTEQGPNIVTTASEGVAIPKPLDGDNRPGADAIEKGYILYDFKWNPYRFKKAKRPHAHADILD